MPWIVRPFLVLYKLRDTNTSTARWFNDDVAYDTPFDPATVSRIRFRGFVAYRSDPRWPVINLAQVGKPGTWYQLAIERRNQPGLIGDCAFQRLADDEHQAQIGFTFSRLYQKQGYATEAVHALLDYLFGELQLHRVTATCDVENIASFKLLERVGMRREAYFMENIWFKGAWGSEYCYALLHREWRHDEG